MQRKSENALVSMVKWPEPGRAKTRLSPPLSPAEASDLARAFLLDTLAEAARADADCWLAFAPASAASAFRALAGPGVGLIEAETADLGLALIVASPWLHPTCPIWKPAAMPTPLRRSVAPTLPSAPAPTAATTCSPPNGRHRGCSRM
jgi:hypothetical protein